MILPRSVLLLVLALCVPRGSAAETVLRVTATEKTLELTAAELAKFPRTELTTADPHEKKEHRYAGVAVRELLTAAGAPLGEKLRGTALQLGVIVRAKDGYAVLFSLAEFDQTFSGRTLLLVDQIDGQPLPEKSAPLQLIAPGDQRAARWIRMVASIEVVPVGAIAPRPAAKP